MHNILHWSLSVSFLMNSFVLRRGQQSTSRRIWFTHLTGEKKILLLLPEAKLTHPRYDLNALFMKAFGDFTVNVQGLSRVFSLFCYLILI